MREQRKPDSTEPSCYNTTTFMLQHLERIEEIVQKNNYNYFHVIYLQIRISMLSLHHPRLIGRECLWHLVHLCTFRYA